MSENAEATASTSNLNNKNEDSRKLGEAILKPEFILQIDQTAETSNKEKESEDAVENNGDKDGEPPQKKARYSGGGGRKRQRGQNKARGVPWQEARTSMLCPTVANILEGKPFPEKCDRLNCNLQHDIAVFLSNKQPDIGPTCQLFTTFGYCHWGAACRFGSKHLTEDGHNIIDETIYKPDKICGSVNQLEKELQVNLRKFKYDFSKAEAALASTRQEKEMATAKRDKEVKKPATDKSETEGNKPVGPVPDLIKIRPPEKKIIEWKDKLYLSPLTTLGNLPFRRICKSYGADITCGEMAMASSLLQGTSQEWALVRRHESEKIFGVQLCGCNPMSMARCCQLLQENTVVDFIDINMGCPIDFVYQQGGGSGLMRRRPCLELMVRTMNKVLELPLTVKMRTGISSGKNTAHTLMPNLHEWGISLVTLHGRSREQRYTRLADWDYIDECAKLARKVPLFGNGDVLSFEDYNARRSSTNVAGIMIGRGALIKPWLFTEIKEQRHWDISSSERLEILRKYTNYGLEHWGSDNKGVETTRRFLLEWLSFLHRYIPVGLLERPPQRINDRPPAYVGRDDLETLMASANCANWIKISEMLLGKVPDGFNFLPKHKANAWQ